MKSQSNIARRDIPEAYAECEALADAYARGWNHGHGLACHNVPELGVEYWTDSDGRLTTDAENIRDVHASLCYQAESNSRSYSPFEFTAHEFNSAPSENDDIDLESVAATSEELWEAFDAGTEDAISADLETYTDADYGIGGEV